MTSKIVEFIKRKLGYCERKEARSGILDDTIYPKADFAIFINSAGIGNRCFGEYSINNKAASEEEFELWRQTARIEGLRAIIERNRRNKKKVSHLVAKLAELENGK